MAFKTQQTEEVKPSNKMELSSYQAAILKRGRMRNVRKEKGKRVSLVVDALAGSGKSTTSRLLIESVLNKFKGESVISIQFAKAIQMAMEAKILELGIKNTTVKTASAAGLMVLKLNGITAKGQIQGSKYFFICKEFIEEDKNNILTLFLPKAEDRQLASKVKEVMRKATSQLTDICKMAMSTLTDIDDEQALRDMMDKYDVTGEEYLCRFVGRAIRLGMSSLKKGVMGWDDMIYGPLYHSCDFPQYDWVLVDEAQDLNEAQLQLVMKFGKVFYGFGDKNQAIMGWAGALSDGMQRFKKLANASSLPLTICYRCDHNILELARYIVPAIEDRPGCGEGIVGVVQKNQIQSLVKPGDFVLCRITAPLVSMCISLIKSNIPAKVKGRDIGKKLNDIYESIVKSNPEIMSIDHFIGAYAEHCQEEMTRAIIKKLPSSKIAAIQDDQDCMSAIASFISRDALEKKITVSHSALATRIKDMFEEEPGKQFVTLSTVHRSKGLEAPRVFIIDFEKMPFQFPGTVLSPEQYQQEKNLIYVAITRAEHELYFQGEGYNDMEKIHLKLKSFTNPDSCAKVDDVTTTQLTEK